MTLLVAFIKLFKQHTQTQLIHILAQTEPIEHPSHLDSVLDFTSVVADDEGWLHDSRELDVAVSFMLTLELVQQGLIGSLGETGETVI